MVQSLFSVDTLKKIRIEVLILRNSEDPRGVSCDIKRVGLCLKWYPKWNLRDNGWVMNLKVTLKVRSKKLFVFWFIQGWILGDQVWKELQLNREYHIRRWCGWMKMLLCFVNDNLTACANVAVCYILHETQILCCRVLWMKMVMCIDSS